MDNKITPNDISELLKNEIAQEYLLNNFDSIDEVQFVQEVKKQYDQTQKLDLIDTLFVNPELYKKFIDLIVRKLLLEINQLYYDKEEMSDRLHKQHIQLGNLNEINNEQIKTIKDYIQKIRNQFVIIMSNNAQIDNIKKKSKERKLKLNDQNNLIFQQDEKINELEEKNNEYEVRINIMEERIDTYLAAIRNMKDQNTQYKQYIEQLQTELMDKTQTLSNMKETFLHQQYKSEILTTQNNAHVTDKQKFLSSIEEIRKTLHQSLEDNFKLHEENESLIIKNNELAQENKKIMNDAFEKVKNVNTVCNQQSDKLNKCLEENQLLKDMIADLSNQLEKLQGERNHVVGNFIVLSKFLHKNVFPEYHVNSPSDEFYKTLGQKICDSMSNVIKN